MPRLREAKSIVGRRANNTGGVTQRKDGRWVCTVITGYKSDGKPDRKYFYFKTKAEAEKKATVLAAEVLTTGYRTTESRMDTNLERLLREWYEVFKADDLDDVTNEKNWSIMRLHIFPALGAYDIKNIDTMRIQRFVNKMKREKIAGGFGHSSDTNGGYSADFIKKTRSLLDQFFKYAVRKGFVSTNPVSDVSVGSASKNCHADPDEKGKALRPELRVTVFEAVENHTVLKPILLTLAMQGLRTQELIALKWKNVDFDKEEIRVREAVKRVASSDGNGNIVSRGSKLGRLKTDSSRRDIAMPQVLLDVLHEWREYCKQKGIKTDNEAYVFPNTDRGKQGCRRSYSSLRSMFQRFVAKHGLKNVSYNGYFGKRSTPKYLNCPVCGTVSDF